MEQWDKDYIDMVVLGHLAIGDHGVGSLQFGAVNAEGDCRVQSLGGVERLDFLFEGEGKGDSVCARAWTQVTGRTMTERIYFHMGDDSGFMVCKK